MALTFKISQTLSAACLGRRRLLTFLCSTFLLACQTSRGPLQLVESYPLETPLADPLLPKTADVWLSLINEARSSLDLSFFYISNEDGLSLNPILEALEKAGRRGVKVRCWFDQVFLKKYADTMGQDAQRLASHPNTEVRVVRRWMKEPGIQHNKYILADRSRAYVGSANLDGRALLHIHELGYLFSAQRLVSPLQMVFEEDWLKASSEDSTQALNPRDFEPERWQDASGRWQQVTLRISPRPEQSADQIWDLPVLLSWIAEAQQEILISTKDYNTKFYKQEKFFHEIEGALIAARRRGVHISMMLEDARYLPKFKKLQEAGVELRRIKIPQHSSRSIPYARMIHSKYAIFDRQKLWLGTGNLTPESFFLERNISLLVESPEYAAEALRVYMRYWESPFHEQIQVP